MRDCRIVGVTEGDAIVDQGALLGEPFTRQLDGRLRALRFYLCRQQTRITYYIATGRIIALRGVRKTTPRDEPRSPRPASHAALHRRGPHRHRGGLKQRGPQSDRDSPMTQDPSATGPSCAPGVHLARARRPHTDASTLSDLVFCVGDTGLDPMTSTV